MRQKVLGANIHETEGLLETKYRSPPCTMAGRCRELQLICSIGQTQTKRRRSAFQNGARIENASFSEWLANRKCCAQKKGAQVEDAALKERRANTNRELFRMARG